MCDKCDCNRERDEEARENFKEGYKQGLNSDFLDDMLGHALSGLYNEDFERGRIEGIEDRENQD